MRGSVPRWSLAVGAARCAVILSPSLSFWVLMGLRPTQKDEKHDPSTCSFQRGYRCFSRERGEESRSARLRVSCAKDLALPVQEKLREVSRTAPFSLSFCTRSAEGQLF